MPAPKRKEQVITLKADGSLLEAMKGIPNRSRFIRDAILAALENVCPLCNGTGTLTPQQRRHWDEFATTHAVEECPKCHETYLTCIGQQAGRARPGGPGAKRCSSKS